jgi:phage gpG-like protein
MSEVIYFEWDMASVEETEQALAEVAAYIENVELPLLSARQFAIDDMREHFDTETDPYGAPWAPLSEKYAKAKSAAGYEEGILVREGNLREAATSEDAWTIVGNDLVFDANALPTKDGVNYGLVHQGGSGRIPQREFIGLSNKAEIKITALFERWYDNAALLYIRPSGVVQTRVPTGRGAETRFGPKFMAEF